MTDPVFPTLPRRPRSDYVNPPTRIATRTTAKRRGWYAGWEDNCPPASARSRVVLIRPSDNHEFGLVVDKRLAGLFGAWADAFMYLGHELRTARELSANGKAQGGNGSYVCRAIKGSDPPRPSNHSSATAWDLWTRSNPQIGRTMDRIVPFVSTIHPEVVELAAAADIYWGGWYWDTTNHRYVDAMHFEYMRRPEDVAGSLARMTAVFAEIKARHEPDPAPEEPDVTTDEVKALQIALNAIGTQPPLVVDGKYGPVTHAAVLNMPKLVANQVDAAEVAASTTTKQAAIDAVSAIPEVTT